MSNKSDHYVRAQDHNLINFLERQAARRKRAEQQARDARARQLGRGYSKRRQEQ